VGKYFLILPHTEYFKKYKKFKKIKEGFVYRSDLNQSKLSILDLKKMIK